MVRQDASRVVNNTFGVYVNPITWVNRHRLHHKYADHPATLTSSPATASGGRCTSAFSPTSARTNVANDAIFKSWPFRLVSNPVFAVVPRPATSGCCGCWSAICRSPRAMWVGTRVFAVWVNMVQNYWTHERRWGYRRYEDEATTR